MKRIKFIVVLMAVPMLYAQLPIPSWAQWLSDDEKSWQVLTTRAGCDYEEINTGSLDYVKQGMVNSYLRKGMEFTEDDLNRAIERYWKTDTKDYPLQHIQDGYKMIKIIDASVASDESQDWGKEVVWEWQYTLKNVSVSDLMVNIKYFLINEEGGYVTYGTDDVYAPIESGSTKTFRATSHFPVEALQEVESRIWKISYDY